MHFSQSSSATYGKKCDLNVINMMSLRNRGVLLINQLLLTGVQLA